MNYFDMVHVRLGSGIKPDNLKTCPKCGFQSGDDWAQCEGSCPMELSPFYDAEWLYRHQEDPEYFELEY